MSKHMTSSGIGLLESIWWKHSGVSLRPLIDTACQMFDSGPLTSHYEMSTSKVAFCEAVPRLIRSRETKYLWLALHGSEGTLDFFNGDTISIEDLVETMKAPLEVKGVSLSGLHLSECSFGSSENLRAILEKTPKIAWVSGYSKKVDWLESAAFDIQFAYHLLARRETSATGKIENAAHELLVRSAGACKDLGFNLFVRHGKSDVQNLMEAA